MVKSFLPGDHRRRERLIPFFEAALRSGPLLTGAVDVARLEPGGPIVGIGAWEGPTSPGLWPQLREIPTWLRVIGLRNLPNAGASIAAMGRHRPTFKHWYLSDIAVSPAAQGHGVGGALITHRLAAVDAQHQPAYLEATTDGSARLYERYGFERTATIELKNASAIAMLRPAQA